MPHNSNQPIKNEINRDMQLAYTLFKPENRMHLFVQFSFIYGLQMVAPYSIVYVCCFSAIFGYVFQVSSNMKRDFHLSVYTILIRMLFTI